MPDDPPVTPTTPDPPVTKPATFNTDYSKEENLEKVQDADLRSYIKVLQGKSNSSTEEAARWRKELRVAEAKNAALETEKQEREAAALKEQGKFKELYEAESEKSRKLIEESNSRIMRAEIRAIAISEGIIDPEVANLIPISKLKVNELGEVQGVEEAVREYKALRPKLFTPPAATTPPVTPTGSPAPSPTPSPAPTTQTVKELSREEYQRRKAEELKKMGRR